jgi:hypothetical protein
MNSKWVQGVFRNWWTRAFLPRWISDSLNMLEKDISHPQFFITLVIAMRLFVK